MLIVALGSILSARGIQTSVMSDPVGPRVFPYLVAAVVILSSLLMILRPDPNKDCPACLTVLHLGIALVVLMGYLQAISPLGVRIPTAIVGGILSWQTDPGRVYRRAFGSMIGLLFRRRSSLRGRLPLLRLVCRNRWRCAGGPGYAGRPTSGFSIRPDQRTTRGRGTW